MQLGAKIQKLKVSQEVIDFEWEKVLSLNFQNNLEWLCCT
jgi:hypothetical protein